MVAFPPAQNSVVRPRALASEDGCGQAGKTLATAAAPAERGVPACNGLGDHHERHHARPNAHGLRRTREAAAGADQALGRDAGVDEVAARL